MLSDLPTPAALLTSAAETIIQTLHEPIVILNAAGRILFANAAFYRTFAVVPTDTEQTSLFQLGNGGWDIPELRVLFPLIITNNTYVENYHVRHVFPTIGLRVLRLNARRISLATTMAILLTINDITALNQLLDAQNRRLDVAEAAQHTEETAQRASAMATTARESFLAVVAHELKGPLTTILGQAQVLYRRATRTAVVSAADARSYHALFTQGQRLAHMLDQLYDLARLERRSLILNPQPHALAQVVQEVITQLAPRAAEKYQTIQTIGAGDARVVIDRERIAKAITNLVTNALQYSPMDSRVTLRLTCPDPQHICLLIHDEGMGIDAVEWPLLFTPFYRSAVPEAQSQHGLGLGLYIAHELVTLHGGTVTVESTLGVGSTFMLCLPLDDADTHA